MENRDVNINENKNSNEVELPWADPDFITEWALWKSYRKEIGRPYKSPKSEQGQLIKLSRHGKQTAIEMIRQSITQSWIGIFELKQENNGIGKQRNSDSRKASRDELVKVLQGNTGKD